MKRILVFVLIPLVAFAAIGELADLTQSRSDVVAAESSTTIDIEVRTRRYVGGSPAAVHALWAVCSSSTRSDVTVDLHRQGQKWSVTVSPALGRTGRKRLVGCIEDATLDRVTARVVRLS